jgi:23S rRNA (uracil1939-C5)-methyltransferase
MSRRRLNPHEVEITGLGPRGTGTGVASDGKPMVVRAAPPGARVLVRPAGRRKGVWKGRRLATIRPPADAVDPPCPAFGLCGGCTLQELALDAQRRHKWERVVQVVAAGLDLTPEALQSRCEVHPVVGAPDGYGYRNKVEFSFGNRQYLSDAAMEAGDPIEGRFLGMHAPGRFDRVVDLEECMLTGPRTREVVRQVREMALGEEAPPPYDARAHTGFWRHLLVREASTGQVLVVVFTAPPAGDDQAEAARALCGALHSAGVTGVAWAVNDGVADVARGEVQRWWGDEVIEERLGSVRYQLSFQSFFQTSTHGAQQLYDVVHEAVGGTHSGTVYDLYCGTGGIGLYLASRGVERVVGIEEVAPAVEDARANAVKNQVEATFVCSKVEDALGQVEACRADVLVVDPPRAGLHPRVTTALAASEAGTLVYVACKPESLARDAAILEAGHYRLTQLWVVDLFPQTGHIEVVAQFRRAPPANDGG